MLTWNPDGSGSSPEGYRAEIVRGQFSGALMATLALPEPRPDCERATSLWHRVDSIPEGRAWAERRATEHWFRHSKHYGAAKLAALRASRLQPRPTARPS